MTFFVPHKDTPANDEGLCQFCGAAFLYPLADVWFLFSQHLIRGGPSAFSLAEECLRRCLAQDPLHSASRFLMAALLCELGRVADAEPHINLLLEEEVSRGPNSSGDEKEQPPSKRTKWGEDPLVLGLKALHHDLRDEDVESEQAYTAAGRCTAKAQAEGSRMGDLLLGLRGKSAASVSVCTMPLFSSGEKPGAVSVVLNLARACSGLGLPGLATRLLEQQLEAMKVSLTECVRQELIKLTIFFIGATAFRRSPSCLSLSGS